MVHNKVFRLYNIFIYSVTIIRCVKRSITSTEKSEAKKL